MKHIHQFFEIAKEVIKDKSPIPNDVRWGIRVICAECGELRILWTDGKVEKL